MTDKQKTDRLNARQDFMEAWLGELLVRTSPFKSKDDAITHIRASCEAYLKGKGFNYPITEEEN